VTVTTNQVSSSPDIFVKMVKVDTVWPTSGTARCSTIQHRWLIITRQTDEDASFRNKSSSAAEAGLTMVEMMVTMAIFVMLVTAFISANIFGLRYDQLVCQQIRRK